MIKIKRYIYIWDIHASYKFKDFINKYDDGKTFFYSLWDLFDRWDFAYENILIMKKLFNEGKFNMVLWNHDLFFLFSKWLNYNTIIKDTILKSNLDIKDYEWLIQRNSNLYNMNWWIQTDYSFMNNTDVSWTKKRIEETINFLWWNFNIFLIDHNKNLLIHWWIPILPSWDLVHTNLNNKFLWWIDLLTQISIGIKKMDVNSLLMLDDFNNGDTFYNTLSIMERFQDNLNTKDIYNFESTRYLSPIWYSSSLYDTNDVVRNTLIKELNKHGIENIFLWHWQNKEISDKIYKNKDSKYWKDNRIFRIDRSHIIQNNTNWTIGYAIFDNNNKVIEIGEY